MSRWDVEQDPADPLARQLRALPATGWQVPPGGAVAAVRAGRRRLVTKVAGVSALCAALVVGVPLGLSAGGTSAAPLPPVPPAVEQPEPSPSVVEEPTAVTGPVAEPSASASAPVMPSAAPPAPAAVESSAPPEPPAPVVLEVVASERGPAEAGDLAGLDLLEEEWPEDSYRGGPSGWDAGRCRSEPTPEDERRTGWAAQKVYGADSGRLSMVASYPDEETARLVVLALSDRAARCWAGVGPTYPDGPPTEIVWLQVTASSTGLTGTARYVTDLSSQEQAAVDAGTVDGYAPVVIREGQVVAVAAAGRYVAMVVGSLDYGGGNAMSELAGDTRPGAGTPRQEGEEDPRAFVDRNLDEARVEAVRLVGEAARYAGG